jgi:AraC-like DNA-binding protein
MGTMDANSSRRFLTLDQVSPAVHLASCLNWEKRQWHNYRIPGHQMMLIEDGCLHARTPLGEFTARAGDLLCFRPAGLSEHSILGPARFLQTHIDFAPPPRHHSTPLFDEFGPLPPLISLGAVFEEMRSVFETFCIEITQPGSVHRLRLRAAVHDMLALIATVLTPDPAVYTRLDDWQRLRLRLDAELHAECRVEQMARALGLSPAYFIRAFRERFGVTPKAYHTAARLREAVRVLRGTEMSVKTIAYELGFGDAKAFARLFQRHLGILPSDVRGGKMTPLVEGAPSHGLYRINAHLLPPGTPADWKKRYYPGWRAATVR